MKKVYILGIILGLAMPIVGVFLGLQISTTLGNIFALPIIAIVLVTGLPFGAWHSLLWFVAFGLSIAVWTALVVLFIKLRD